MARRLRAVLLLVLLGLVLLVGWTGYEALKARTALTATAAELDSFSSRLLGGDEAGARASLHDAQRDAATAVDNTDGPGWWLSARLPQIGPDVRAVRSVALIADRLASQALPDVMTAADALDPAALRPVHGRVDLQPLERSAPAVVRAARSLHNEAVAAAAIDTAPLAPQIAGPVEDLQGKVERADRLADRAARAVQLLPAMLGAHEPRHYLFIFQNNAEIRSTGGIPGAFAVLTARDGRVHLGTQGDAGTLGRFSTPPIRLTTQEKQLYGLGLGTFPQDVNFTPDFPRSAQIVSAMYRARGGGPLDGVVSVDPVALSYLLRGTGPVHTAGGRTLRADNAVRLLLSQVYREIPDPAQQNVFFNQAARDVFDAVSAGRGDPRQLLEQLVHAGSERRLLVWSSHPHEQRLLAPTAMAGALPRAPTESPQVGVYFNAAGAYKLDYYLDYTASVASTSCRAGRQHLQVRVALHSSVPKDNRSLPMYVNPKQGQFGRGNVLVNAYVFAPAGGRPTSIHLDGKREVFNVRRLDGRTLIARTVLIRPGQTSVLTVDVVAGKGQRGTPSLRVTPGVRSTGVGSVDPPACS